MLDLDDGQATTAMSSSETTGHHEMTASLETKSGESKSSQVTICGTAMLLPYISSVSSEL